MNNNPALEELDRMESNYRLQDPRTAPAEVEKIAGEELRRAGVSLSAPKKAIGAPSGALKKRIFDAADKFVKSRPETDEINGFVPTEANERILFAYMDEHGLDFTSSHSFEQAFLATRDRLTPPTSKRQSAQARVQKVEGVEISHEILDQLSARELDKLLQNPRAVQLINDLPPRSR